MTSAIAWIPFIEPVQSLGDWWILLLIPLSVGISMIYKAMRMERLDGYLAGVATMTAQLVLAMVLLAIGLYAVVQILIPFLPAE